jgi:hypothetical protein
MKKILNLSLFLSVFIFTNCKNKYDGFNMVYRKDFPKAIPTGASTFLSHYFIIENIQGNFKNIAAQSAQNIADVKRILPKSLRLTARYGDAEFAFIREVIVNIYPHGEPTKRTEVFYRTDIPLNTGTILDLNAGVADVQKLLADDTQTFDMEIKMNFRATPPITIETITDFTFFAVTSE